MLEHEAESVLLAGLMRLSSRLVATQEELRDARAAQRAFSDRLSRRGAQLAYAESMFQHIGTPEARNALTILRSWPNDSEPS